METIIRTAKLEAIRLPIGANREAVDAPNIVESQAAIPLAPSIEDMRSEIERAVRAELAQEAAAIFDAEFKRGRSEGFAHGERAGIAEAKELAERERLRMRESVDEFFCAISAEIKRNDLEIRGELSSLVLTCLVRVLGRAAVSAEGIEHTVETVLSAAHAAGRIRLRIHPDDLKILTELCNPQGLTTAAQEIELLPDPSLVGGGCIAETSIGQFDASIDSQLRVLHACIQEHRGRASPGSIQGNDV